MPKKKLPISSEWNFDILRLYDEAISHVATEFQLKTFPIQLEVISTEQMMDVYSTVGMPLGYHHWSFGKQFVNIEKHYRQGYTNLAYEIVINSNPCIAYLLEENTMVMQAMVIVHACYGHNSFFKNNYLFKTWTDPDSIIDYLVFAKGYISECEERYGISEVEAFLDACHALMNYGVDRYKRPSPLSLQEEKARLRAREAYMQSQVNDLWRTLPSYGIKHETTQEEKHFPSEPQENILYFIEKNAPLLEPWQREIVRIVRKIAQYFYPQRQTKVMNEGWATFWHYHIINKLYDKGLLADEFMLEFLHYHTSLMFQPNFDEPHFNSLNPYTLGFSIFNDIKRICENPTPEDEKWFPQLAHTDWIANVHFAMENFKDESFIAQYLSPHLIRKLKLFSLLDDENNKDLLITAIHDESGYQHIRHKLSSQYNLSVIEPNIQIYNVNLRGDRSLILRHIQYDHLPLNKKTQDVLEHLYVLWGFDVVLETVDSEGKIIASFRCPDPNKEEDNDDNNSS